jgi:hypothetical protein
MVKRLIEFLKQLEAAWPPPENTHHALMYAQFGSDEAGWSDRLALQVFKAGRFQCFFLEDADLDKPAETLAVILSILNAEDPPSVQTSDQLGKF